MEGVEESKTAIDDDERRPWENSEFEQNLTFELADGGTVCVNRCILSTYSALVRDCPSLDEPIPIPQGVGSTAALSTLLRVVYSHALVREQFAFAYDVFDVVAEIYELAVFMGCHKIVENLRAEMKDSLSKIIDMNQFLIKKPLMAFRYGSKMPKSISPNSMQEILDRGFDVASR